MVIFVTDIAESLGLKKPVEYLISKEGVVVDSVVQFSTDIGDSFKPIFSSSSRDQFNVLIIRFEDYIAGEDTYCIGRAIKEYLSSIQENLPLSLRVQYASDTIPPPESREEALDIQSRHNADLIIYGLARNVETNCNGAEICFRYNISDQVVAQLNPEVKVKKTKHEIDYVETSPLEIEQGILQIDTISIDFWIRSLVNFKAGKFGEAFYQLESILRDSTQLSAQRKAHKYNSIGYTFFKFKNYSKAIIAFSRAIELDPNLVSAYQGRGKIYFEQKKYKQAQADFDAIIRTNPKGIRSHLARGEFFFKMEEYEKAISDFNMVIEQNPKFAQAYFMRADVYKELGQFEEALSDYNRTLELNPKSIAVYNNRGVLYKNFEKYSLAIANYRAGLAKNPRSSSLYANLGICYMNQSDFQLAIINFNKSIELDPNDPFGYANRAQAFRELGDFDQSISDFNKAIELDPEYDLVYEDRGYTYYLLENYDAAIQDFKKCEDLSPDRAEIYSKLAITFQKKKNYRQAIIYYDKALELDSNFTTALVNRGVTYLKLNEYRKAAEDNVAAIKIDASDYIPYINLIYIYMFKVYWYLSLVFLALIGYAGWQNITKIRKLTQRFFSLFKRKSDIQTIS